MIRRLVILLALAPALARVVPAAALEPADPPAAPLESGARAADQEQRAVPPPDTYTVRSGDTLWDLSGRFLNNPWYWPKVWSYNPEIANPHWIYPGNVLRFYPGSDEGPARVAPEGEPVAQEDQEAEPVKELEDLSRADMKAPPSLEEQEAVAVAGPNKIGFVHSRDPFARRDSFVTPGELEESGELRAAFEEVKMLSQRDRAYATFRNPGTVKVGETYAVYRTMRAVKHPITKLLLGYQTTVLGSARVTSIDAKAVRVTIASSYEPIERGDLLGPWVAKPFRAVPSRPNAKNLSGFIVTTPIEGITQMAEHQVVFVDQGKAEGVEEGNRFTVVRSGDPRGRPPNEPLRDDALPNEDVGALMVIDVKEHASAALVLRSLMELNAGDRVEMRVASK